MLEFGTIKCGALEGWPSKVWPKEKVEPRRVWNPEGCGTRRVGAPKGGGPRRVGAPKSGAPKGGGPEGWSSRSRRAPRGTCQVVAQLGRLLNPSWDAPSVHEVVCDFRHACSSRFDLSSSHLSHGVCAKKNECLNK